jgi:hypothetical protein
MEDFSGEVLSSLPEGFPKVRYASNKTRMKEDGCGTRKNPEENGATRKSNAKAPPGEATVHRAPVSP